MTTVESTPGRPAATTGGAPAVTVAIDGVAPVRHAAVPTLRFLASLHAAGGATVESVQLQAQVRITTDRRGYDPHEQQRLVELFGSPARRPHSRPSLLWTHASVQVPRFTGRTRVDIPVVCTYDFDVVASKYLHALAGGEVPLELLFSGTVFYPAAGRLQAGRLPWDTEARCRMPVQVWQDLMEHYFPGTAWLRLDREAFQALDAYRTSHTLTSWGEAVRALLRDSRGPA